MSISQHFREHEFLNLDEHIRRIARQVAGVSSGTSGGSSGAPSAATYILQTANASLPNAQALGSLATGIVKNTTTTGVLSIATEGTDYYKPGGTDVALADGGTNASLTASNGGIFYSTATAGAILAGTATANQILLSGSAAAPSWSTATYLATTTINQILYSSSNNVIAGITAANNGILITSAGGVPSIGTAIPNGVTATTQTAADNSTKVATTAYVDTAVATQFAAFSPKTGCRVATTANLNATYNNGVAGVGATLTNAGALAALAIDGITLSASDRVLVKNQSTAANNGIYSVTTVGSGAVAWVMTRTTDYDSDAEINESDYTVIAEGTANAETLWVMTQAAAITVGTTAINWAELLVAAQDHGALTGLSDDDHTQYALLAGRAGGQILIGGTAAADDLTFQTTSGNGSGDQFIWKRGNNGATTAATLDANGFDLGTSGILKTGTIELGHASDTTIARVSAGVASLEGVNLVTISSTDELTNKTLNASVAKGTWTASGTWTIPAVTLGGTVSGGGNQLNNIIIGTVTPLAGTFTVVTASKAGLPLDITNSTDATSNQVMKVSGTNATRANNDLIYESFFLANSTGTQKEFVRMNYKAPVVTNTSEDGSLIVSVMNAGTLTDTLTLTKSSLSIGTSNTFTTGTIELGAATDTTLARVSAGVVSIEGVNIVTVSSTDTLTNKTLTAPKIADLGFIADANGNELVIYDTVASAVNEITWANAATGGNPTLTASGGDTNIGIDFVLKGTGTFNLKGNSTQAAELRLYEDTDDGTNYTALKVGTQAGNITYTLPTADGSASQVLSTNGSGTLSWATAGGGAVSSTLVTEVAAQVNVSSVGDTYTDTVGNTYAETTNQTRITLTSQQRRNVSVVMAGHVGSGTGTFELFNFTDSTSLSTTTTTGTSETALSLFNSAFTDTNRGDAITIRVKNSGAGGTVTIDSGGMLDGDESGRTVGTGALLNGTSTFDCSPDFVGSTSVGTVKGISTVTYTIQPRMGAFLSPGAFKIWTNFGSTITNANAGTVVARVPTASVHFGSVGGTAFNPIDLNVTANNTQALGWCLSYKIVGIQFT